MATVSGSEGDLVEFSKGEPERVLFASDVAVREYQEAKQNWGQSIPGRLYVLEHTQTGYPRLLHLSATPASATTAAVNAIIHPKTKFKDAGPTSTMFWCAEAHSVSGVQHTFYTAEFKDDGTKSQFCSCCMDAARSVAALVGEAGAKKGEADKADATEQRAGSGEAKGETKSSTGAVTPAAATFSGFSSMSIGAPSPAGASAGAFNFTPGAPSAEASSATPIATPGATPGATPAAFKVDTPNPKTDTATKGAAAPSTGGADAPIDFGFTPQAAPAAAPAANAVESFDFSFGAQDSATATSTTNASTGATKSAAPEAAAEAVPAAAPEAAPAPATPAFAGFGISGGSSAADTGSMFGGGSGDTAGGASFGGLGDTAASASNPKPTGPASVALTEAVVQAKLTALYSAVAPDKLSKVQSNVQKYRGRLDVLVAKLKKRYTAAVWEQHTNGVGDTSGGGQNSMPVVSFGAVTAQSSAPDSAGGSQETSNAPFGSAPAAFGGGGGGFGGGDAPAFTGFGAGAGATGFGVTAALGGDSTSTGGFDAGAAGGGFASFASAGGNPFDMKPRG